MVVFGTLATGTVRRCLPPAAVCQPSSVEAAEDAGAVVAALINGLSVVVVVVVVVVVILTV